MAKRFIIEGVWSGYTSSQSRVVHRSVHTQGHRKLRAWAEKTHGICFTDGTMLYLFVCDCKPRERVNPAPGYMDLIRKCCDRDVSSVDALRAAEESPHA